VTEAAPTGRIRLAAYGLAVDGDGRVLLCHVAPGYVLADSWVLPGGGVESGEEPAGTLLRELQEETGLMGRVGGLVGVYSAVRRTVSGEPVHAVSIVYRLHNLNGALRNEAHGSTDTCAWFTRAEAGELPLVPFTREALRDVGAG
jgi:8-oxo-dGTP diphosphatase